MLSRRVPKPSSPPSSSAKTTPRISCSRSSPSSRRCSMSKSAEADSATQRALLALRRAKTRIEQLEQKLDESSEPIAIVGMACRFPGGADPSSFWRTLLSGEDMVAEIPAERVGGRWPAKVPRWAGLIDDVDRFDPGFFGISPREAVALDPQQRLLLEVAWEAIENVGIPAPALQGKNAGVFIGLCSLDYLQRIPIEIAE